MHALTARFWPRLGAPLTWRRSTRRIFVLLLPVSLPLWIAAVVLRSVLVLVAFAWLFVADFWNRPPKRRVSYYSPDDYEAAQAAHKVRVKIRREGQHRHFRL